MKKKKILTEVFVLFFIAAVFMAVYVVIEMGNDWLAVLGGAAVLLIASYLLVDYRIEYGKDGAGMENEGTEEVLKALYTVMKRGSNENTELLQKIDSRLEAMTQVLERMESAAAGAEQGNASQEIQQVGKDVLDAVKGLRQDYQTGVKNIIKYEKENAKQIAQTTHTSAEMTIIELKAQLERIQECLQAQREELAGMRFSSGSLPYSPDADSEGWLPVLEDAKETTEPMTEESDDTDASDDFDAEAAIRAYMLEQGYVDVDEEDGTEEPDAAVIPEPVSEPEEPAQKSEEETANTLQSMASGDPNRALTPEEIAAMFAAIQ